MINIRDSKTVIFNTLTLLIAIASIPEVVAILPREVLGYIAIINPIGNAILRIFFTSQPTNLNVSTRKDMDM